MGKIVGLGVALSLTFVTASMGLARPNNPPEFFRGKTITILVGASAGGGYDVNTRLFANYFGKYITGHPSVVVENMPGAGGLVLANYLYNNAPKDGTVLGVFAASVALEPVFGDPRAHYQTRGFSWIGSLDKDTPSCGVWKGAGQGAKTLDDILASYGGNWVTG